MKFYVGMEFHKASSWQPFCWRKQVKMIVLQRERCRRRFLKQVVARAIRTVNVRKLQTAPDGEFTFVFVAKGSQT